MFLLLLKDCLLNIICIKLRSRDLFNIASEMNQPKTKVSINVLFDDSDLINKQSNFFQCTISLFCGISKTDNFSVNFNHR